jgi:hypothetical protein
MMPACFSVVSRAHPIACVLLRCITPLLVVVLGQDAEAADPTLQQVFNSYFGSGCVNATMDTGVNDPEQSFPPGVYTFTLIAKHTTQQSVPLSWYPTGNPRSANPIYIFNGSESPGATSTVCIPTQFGLRITTFGTWSTNKFLNFDNFDHFKTFDICGRPGAIAVAAEDQNNGGDSDFNDNVFWFIASAPLPPQPSCGIPICRANGDQYDLRAAPDGAGGAYFTWTDLRFPTRAVALQRVTADGVIGAGWSPDGLLLVDVNSLGGIRGYSNVISDGSGGAFVVWQEFRETSYLPYAQRVDAGGTPLWSANGVAVATSNAGNYTLGIVSDGSGGMICGWVSSSGVRLQRVDGSGTRLWAVAGVDAGSSNEFELTSDGSGGVFVAERDLSSSRIYVRRFGPNGSVAAGWPAAGVAVSSAAGYKPQIVNDASGGALIVWIDGSTGCVGKMQHVTPGGAIVNGWPSGGLVVSPQVGCQYEHRIVADGTGGALVSWREDVSNAGNVYVQRIASNGMPAPGWSVSGKILCGAPFDQANVVIASDGSAGAYVGWHDARNGRTLVFGHRIASNGTIPANWPTDGVRLCNDDCQYQTMPATASDGFGGAWLIWKDYRTGVDADLFAQHLVTEGAVDVSEPPAMDRSLVVRQLWPNPTFGRVLMRLASAPHVVGCDVYSLAGQCVRTLTASSPSSGGEQLIEWDGCDDSGRLVRPGVYFLRAKASAMTATSRVVVLQP